MYVCLCRAITDKQIKEAIAQGNDSLLALRKSLGVASQCGKCARNVQSIIKQHGEERDNKDYYRVA